MYRIDHIPQFIEPYHPWTVQNVPFYYILITIYPQDLISFFPRLVAYINVFHVWPYMSLFRYMCILQKYKVSFSMFFFCNLQKRHFANSCIWFLTLLTEQHASEPHWTWIYRSPDTRSEPRLTLHPLRPHIRCLQPPADRNTVYSSLVNLGENVYRLLGCSSEKLYTLRSHPHLWGLLSGEFLPAAPCCPPAPAVTWALCHVASHHCLNSLFVITHELQHPSFSSDIPIFYLEIKNSYFLIVYLLYFFTYFCCLAVRYTPHHPDTSAL